jgi:hypothetical protein
VVSRITGLAPSTINRGKDDLDEGPLPGGSVLRKGASRAASKNPPVSIRYAGTEDKARKGAKQREQEKGPPTRGFSCGPDMTRN